MDSYHRPQDGPGRHPNAETGGRGIDLARVAGVALRASYAYLAGITRAGWMGFFETDGEVAVFIRQISISEIAA